MPHRRDDEKLNEPTDEVVVRDLVCALLAVNSWTIEESFSVYEGLKAEGLTDFQAVSQLPHSEIFDRLMRAGYQRADFMVGMVADRLRSLADTMGADGPVRLRQLISENRVKEMDEWLLSVKGIGPRVLSNFKALRQIK